MIDESVKGTHYRMGGKLTHAGVECLPEGKDIERIVIERIDFKESENVAGRTEKNVWVATFAKNPYTELGMILNSTNRKRIVKLFPECNGYIDRLRNIPVRLTKELTRDPSTGDDTYGLRISKIPASALPKLPDEKIEGCKKWLGEGHTIEELKSMYTVSDEQIKLLSNGNK